MHGILQQRRLGLHSAEDDLNDFAGSNNRPYNDPYWHIKLAIGVKMMENAHRNGSHLEILANRKEYKV